MEKQGISSKEAEALGALVAVARPQFVDQLTQLVLSEDSSPALNVIGVGGQFLTLSEVAGAFG